MRRIPGAPRLAYHVSRSKRDKDHHHRAKAEGHQHPVTSQTLTIAGNVVAPAAATPSVAASRPVVSRTPSTAAGSRLCRARPHLGMQKRHSPTSRELVTYDAPATATFQPGKSRSIRLRTGPGFAPRMRTAISSEGAQACASRRGNGGD